MKNKGVLWMGVVLSALFIVNVHAENVTSQGNPFMTVSPNTSDTAFFASGGSNTDYSAMTDGNNATTHDTWQGDFPGVNTWLFDGIGLQFPTGISGIARMEWDMQVFGDGGWFNTLDKPLIVQVTTDPSFGSYARIQDSNPGSDGIWTTVPYWNDYPIEVSGDASNSPGVPVDGSKFNFEIDFPGTIYGIRIIGDGGGFAGWDGTGFVAAEEIRLFTGDNTTRATAISPVHGALGVAVAGTTLQWKPAQEDGAIDPNVIGHYVHLGTDPNGVQVSGASALPVGTTSFLPTLAKDTVYYWHVDELLDDGTIRGGYVYSFQTELTLPVINAQPQNTVAPEGGDAVLTVDATDPLGGILSYQWYYDSDGFAGGEVTLADGADYQGSTTNALKVLSMDYVDEGYYFCVVDNGSELATDWVKLMMGQLIAHWKMDGDPNDAMGNYPGTETGGPTYMEGRIGQAISMDGNDDFITLPGGFGDFSMGLTLSVWAMPTVNGNWARFIEFGNGPASDNILLARGGTSNQFVMEVYQGNVGGAVWSPGVLELNAWQMLTATVDPKGNVVLYKNGIVVGTGGTHIPPVVNRGVCFIGKSSWPDALYAGAMDDVRVYNYTLTAQQVADLYLLPSDIDYVCVQPPGFDLDGDCKIDLNDFALMAESWLQCGRYPTCITQIP